MAKYEKASEWTDADFDELNWHDSIIHAFRLNNPSNGYDFDLVFEIDYIFTSDSEIRKPFEILVAPAILQFSDIANLKIDVELSYKESMIIDDVERIEITSDGQKKAGSKNYKWIVKIQSYALRRNRIQFETSGFRQIITGPILTKEWNQTLSD